MSSAKRRLLTNYPSIFTLLLFQSNLHMLASVAMNSLGEMVFPCITPLFNLLSHNYLCILLQICPCICLSGFQCTSIPCSCNDVNIAWVYNVMKETQCAMLYSRHLFLRWFMGVVLGLTVMMQSMSLLVFPSGLLRVHLLSAFF